MAKPLPMNEEKKSLIWKAWERGTPMATIARVIEKPPATVFSYLQYHGGIRPPRRQRRREALGLAEREEISQGIAHGHSARFMADVLAQSVNDMSRDQQKRRQRTISCQCGRHISLAARKAAKTVFTQEKPNAQRPC